MRFKSGQDPDERTVFYTAMYHSLTVPNFASDVDGRYRGTDLQVHQGDVASPGTRFTLCGTPSGQPTPCSMSLSRNGPSSSSEISLACTKKAAPCRCGSLLETTLDA